jgi:hypothetical protein
MATEDERQDRDRRVASGFPDPDKVPGPTERLRELHGITDTAPRAPKYGRASASTAGSDDYVPLEEMLQGSGLGGGAAERLSGFARRLGDEAALRIGEELQRRGIAGKAKTAGMGAGEIGAAGILGLGAVGAGATAVIVGLHRVMPVWASALVTAGALGIPAGVLASRGVRHLRMGLDFGGAPEGS